MEPREKEYILQNRDRKSAKKIAAELGLKERKVQKFLDKQKSHEKLARGQGAARAPKMTILVSCLVIAALGLIAYSSALGGKFIWDDDYLIQHNAYIRGASNIPKIFSQDIGAGSGRRFSFYRPVQMASYIIDYRFWKLNPFGYHLSNNILHVMAALALYLFIRTLYKENNFIPLVTSALYVVHPVHTGAVSYISGRADLFAGIFMLLCLTAYIKSLDDVKAGPCIAAGACYALALLSKEYTIILPVILLLYHYVFKKRFRAAPILTVILTGLAYVFIRLTELKNILPAAAAAVDETTILQRLPGFFVAMAGYIRLMILPINLHAEYGTRLFKFSDPMAFTGALILALMVYLAVKCRSSDDTVTFGIGWFLVILLPMSNLYPLNAYMAEHWLYLPSAGLLLIASKGLHSLYRRDHLNKMLALFLVVSLTAFYSVLTFRQNSYWKDPLSFYERSLKYASSSVKVYNDIGRICANSGDPVKAEWAFKKAIEIDPRFPLPYNNLGFLYYNLGRKDEALKLYEKAVVLDPFYADALNNTGLIYADRRMYPEAIKYYKRAIGAHPSFDGAWSNLGAAYIDTGNDREAINALQNAIRFNPRFGNAYYNLAILYAKTGNKAEAARMYNNAIQYSPSLNTPEFSNRIERYYKK